MTAPATAAARPDTALLPGAYQIGQTVYRITRSSRGRLVVRRGITPVAVLPASGRLETRTASPRVAGDLARLASDPQTARVAYAAASGNCWRCGQPLVDPTSIRRGTGSDCAAALSKELNPR